MLVFISDVPYNGLFRKQKECVSLFLNAFMSDILNNEIP